MPIYLVLPKRRKIIDVISERTIEYGPAIESHRNFDPYCFIIENYQSKSEYMQIQALKDFLVNTVAQRIRKNIVNRLYIEVSNSCNLNCPICYLEKGDQELPTDYILKLIESETKQDTISDICISGGECTLHKGLGPIIEKATARHRCLILTNGLVLPKSLLEIRTTNPIIIILNTSRRTIYNKEFQTNTRLYHEHRHLRIVFSIVVNKESPTLEELRHFMENNQIKRYTIYITDARGNKSNDTDKNHEKLIIREYTEALCTGEYPLSCMTPYLSQRLFRSFQLPCIKTRFYSYEGQEISCVFRYTNMELYLPEECNQCEWFFVCSRVCRTPGTSKIKDELRCLISRYNGIRNLLISSR